MPDFAAKNGPHDRFDGEKYLCDGQSLAWLLFWRSAPNNHLPSPGASMPLSSTATGVYTIAATPFHPNGEVDHASIARLTEFYLGCGVIGLTVLGILGE